MTEKYFDKSMAICHEKGYKAKKIVGFLASKGLIVNEQTVITMFTDYLNRRYL